MKALGSASMVISVCCIVCSVLGVISPLGRMKKISNLVFGAFIIISMILPVTGLVNSFSTDTIIEEQQLDTDDTYDRDFDDAVLKQTADKLVNAADNLLQEDGILASNIELALKKSDNNSISLSYINIYISKEYSNRADDIKRIIGTNMSKEPVIITDD